MSSCFSNIPMSPKDPIFGLSNDFQQDPREDKTNLLVGLYKKEGRPFVFPSIQESSVTSVAQCRSREYLPIGGDVEFCHFLSELVFGESVKGVQTLGGTGALFAAGLFLKEQGVKTILLPIPTWPNHIRIFTDLGFEIQQCSLQGDDGTLDYKRLWEILENSHHQWVLMDACCHNPTGIDPSQTEWEKLAQISKQRGHKFIFDMAYLGFGEGIAADSQAVRFFQREQIEGLLCFSCSKNFTLYSERVGALFPLGIQKIENIELFLSRMCYLVRSVYSSPPSFGSSVVKHVLGNATVKRGWLEELEQARLDLIQRRTMLVDALKATSAPLLADIAQSIDRQKGLFAYLNIASELITEIKEVEGIYLVGRGRLNLSALTSEGASKLSHALRQLAGKPPSSGVG